MKIAKLTANGRVTIPAKLRTKFNLAPGKRVKFEVEQDAIKIIPIATPKEIKSNAGFLGTKGKLLKLLMEEKRIEKNY
ncbi:MAG TPA: AbrB/MazE/SpoVT family DNA-binding domain-containing protein [Ignavibacteriaceae bacterium]|nr:AbrB/MazE/SpoVT family DNA-binding domain-containing protein [Ignavibacteriaceae bacterium]